MINLLYTPHMDWFSEAELYAAIHNEDLQAETDALFDHQHIQVETLQCLDRLESEGVNIAWSKWQLVNGVDGRQALVFINSNLVIHALIPI